MKKQVTELANKSMKLTQLQNKKIAIVGLGLSGQSCARFLLRHGIQPVGFDTRSEFPINLKFTCHFGELDAAKLAEFEVILLSPGMNPEADAIRCAKAVGAIISSDIEVFLANFSKPVIGVTGSNGKSTVVSMLGDIFTTAGVQVAVGGNIGKPALELLQEEIELAVLELSSFQLEVLGSSTEAQAKLRAAAFLNLSDDHMDRHGDLASYRAAKLNIFDGAQFIIANKQDLNTAPADRQVGAWINCQSSPVGFGIISQPLAITLDGELFIKASQMQVSGVHNLINAQAAAIIAIEMGVSHADIVAALEGYNGLSHRCQKVSNYHDIAWVNDSKATNVGATIAAIQGLKPSITGRLWLVAGGDAKNADLTPLREYLQRDVDELITIGKDAPLLARLKLQSMHANTMEEAVNMAASGAKAGDMVLLSPACASLDMYTNYEQRGDVFTRAVEALS